MIFLLVLIIGVFGEALAMIAVPAAIVAFCIFGLYLGAGIIYSIIGMIINKIGLLLNRRPKKHN